MSTTFSNPIIPGFAPDPSIVFVEGTFFLVNSSFHIFPALPIYASKNLKDWKHIGNAINRQDQLSLAYASPIVSPLDARRTMVACGGLFAPTIRYHKGLFYIVCTNCSIENGKVKGLQNFVITTSDIWTDRWSDPVPFAFHGIDPNLFFDDDNRVYVQGAWSSEDRSKQPATTIKQFEIDIATGDSLSDYQEIWGGFARYDTEGPHIYKKDGWYYLLVAEGGTFEHHLLSIGRSKSIWGPYDSYENNPVLTADGKPENIQNTGHGDLFQDQQGLWWAVCLGVRSADIDPDGRYPLGRETFLTAVDWPKNGWPKFEQPTITMERKGAKVLSVTNDSPPQMPRMDDVYIRDAVLTNYEIEQTQATIRLSMLSSVSDLTASAGTLSFLGKRQRALECVGKATVLIPDSQKGHGLKAGLTIYKDNVRHADIFYDFDKSAVCFGSATLGTTFSISAVQPIGSQESISLSIRATEMCYTFHYRMQESGSWESLGRFDTLDMSARDMTGPIFGVFATAAAEGLPTVFTEFQISSGRE